MSKFDELKKKLKDQIFCGIASGRITDDWVEVVIGGFAGSCWCNNSDGTIDELIEVLDKNWEEKSAKASNIQFTEDRVVKIANGATDEIEGMIANRGSESYSDISDTASAIIKALGTDSEYTYFFSQIANKLARVKNRYSVEDSLLDITGYAKLELDKFRRKNEG